MNPKHQQEEELPGECKVRRDDPKLVQYGEVAKLATILKLAEADADRVRYEQERNCQAESQLPRFICWHTQMPSTVKRVEPEEPVHKKSGIKHDQPGTSLPRREQHRARRLHGINRPDAESMIDEMRCRKRE